MEFSDATQFGMSAPFIAAAIGFLKTFVPLEQRLIPPVAMVAAAAWGALLLWSGALDATPAAFVIQVFGVGTSAAGIQSVARTYAPNALRLRVGGETTPPR